MTNQRNDAVFTAPHGSSAFSNSPMLTTDTARSAFLHSSVVGRSDACCSVRTVSQLPEPDRSRPPLAWVVAIAVFATYLAAARGPSNLFPLSVFDMYQGHAPAVVARLLVIDADGRAAELDAFEDWSCTWEAESVEATCGENHRLMDYVERDQRLYVERNAGEGDVSVQLVSRAYPLHEPTRNPVDCVVARCRARRR